MSPAGCLEAHMRDIVMDVRRINRCDQYVYIKQIGARILTHLGLTAAATACAGRASGSD